MTTDDSAVVPARLRNFHVVGLNHRTCPDPIREAVFVADEELPGFLEILRDAGFTEAMALSTCDRVEVQAFHDGHGDLPGIIAKALTADTELAPEPVRALLYQYSGTPALRHLFKVAASLDSQVVGEPHVLGQVRASHRLAAGAGMVGGTLERLLQAAYIAAKRVRAETAIAEGPVSLAAAALQVARDIHGPLSGCRAAIFGTDEMALLLAHHLRDAGLGDLVVIDRNARRAAAAAHDLAAHVGDHETRGVALADADIAITANGDGHYTMTEDMVRAAIRARRRRPIFIVDLGIPRDVDPAVERIDEAFLYDLDDLERLALEGKSGRSAAITDAEAIIDQEVARFLGELAARDAGPLIRDLRDAIEAERQRVLREAPNADGAEATRLLTNRLLHRPSAALRRLAAEDGLDPRTESVVRALLVPDNGAEGESGES
jgi:glutamyl-tRNA reductase